jgi:hypothetical protein
VTTLPKRSFSSTSRILKDPDLLQPTDYGSILVLPHICSWDILKNPSRGMLDALDKLPDSVLMGLWKGLRESFGEDLLVPTDRAKLLEGIFDSRTWRQPATRDDPTRCGDDQHNAPMLSTIHDRQQRSESQSTYPYAMIERNGHSDVR